MQHTVTLTHHSLWFVQWTTIHLMLQAWASTCIVQSSLSNYSLHETTWESCNRAHSMCGLTSSGPVNATCRNSGTYYGPSFWPPALPGTILAWRHWWLGCSPCQYKTPISQWKKKRKKQLDSAPPKRACVPEWLKDACWTKLFMALQKTL